MKEPKAVVEPESGQQASQGKKERFIVQPCRDPDDPNFFSEFLTTDTLFTVRNEITIYGVEIGRGGHGRIHLGRVNGKPYLSAVKWQTTGKNTLNYYNELRFLCTCRGWTGFPKICGAAEDNSHLAVAMELLGPSLESLFNSCGRSFSIKTLCLVADQVLTRLECLHSKGYVHRDMKPDNLVIGNERSNVSTIYLIDFGNVKRFVDEKKQHIPERRNNVVGTVRYMSINAHNGKEMSRRDDLMSLFYILFYFMKGALPWQGNSQDTLSKTLTVVNELKVKHTPSLVAESPLEFRQYHEYVDRLAFADNPDYTYLRGLFQNLAARKNIVMDNIFDWTAESMKFF